MATKNAKTRRDASGMTNYERFEAGSTRVLIPPEPRALLEELRQMSGATYQALTDIAIAQLYKSAMEKGVIEFTLVREIKINCDRKRR